MTPSERKLARIKIRGLDGPIHIQRIPEELCPHCGGNLNSQAGQWRLSVPWFRGSTYPFKTFAEACKAAAVWLEQRRSYYAGAYRQ